MSTRNLPSPKVVCWAVAGVTRFRHRCKPDGKLKPRIVCTARDADFEFAPLLALDGPPLRSWRLRLTMFTLVGYLTSARKLPRINTIYVANENYEAANSSWQDIPPRDTGATVSLCHVLGRHQRAFILKNLFYHVSNIAEATTTSLYKLCTVPLIGRSINNNNKRHT